MKFLTRASPSSVGSKIVDIFNFFYNIDYRLTYLDDQRLTLILILKNSSRMSEFQCTTKLAEFIHCKKIKDLFN